MTDKPENSAMAGRWNKPYASDHVTYPSRRGKRAITTYLDPAVYRQFKILCAERELTGELLVYEALNEIFKKYNKPPIAIKV